MKMKTLVKSLWKETTTESVFQWLKKNYNGEGAFPFASYTPYSCVDDDGESRLGMVLNSSDSGNMYLLITPSETPDGEMWVSLWTLAPKDFRDAFDGTMSAKTLQNWCVMQEHNKEVFDIPMSELIK